MMKATLTACTLAILLSGAAYADSLAVRQPNVSGKNEMTLTSPDFVQNGKLKNAQFANGFGCSGGNLSPELHWENVPKNTQSLVLTVFDPDAPTGSGFWHWLVYNISPQTKGLAQGTTAQNLPQDATISLNDAGVAGFIGACPPEGDVAHRYIYTLYALDSKLDLPPNASPALLGFHLNGKVLATATLTGYAQR